MTADEALRALESGSTGLSAAEANRRQGRHGPNRLADSVRVSPIRLFLAQFQNLLVGLLLAAAVIALAVGLLPGGEAETTDALLILAILVANGVFGFIQDYRAQTAIEALRELAAPEAAVIRDGAVRELPAADLVPGDIVHLTQGDRVPADVRLLEASHFGTDESALTGESLPVDKRPDAVPADAPIQERSNLAFSATSVVRGRATAVVVATGMETEIGRIAELVQRTEDRRTPFQTEIDRLGKRIGVGVAVLIAIVALVLLLVADAPPLTVLLLAVTLAVAAVPEGLPAVVTLTLALGAKRLLQRNALVRRLPVAEGLGAVDVILSDKTGTLTASRMSVERIVVGGRELRLHVPRDGAPPQFVPEPDDAAPGPAKRADGDLSPADRQSLHRLLLCGRLVGDVERDPEGELLGDPTEVALVRAAERAGIEEAPARLREVPFDSERKRMTVVTDGDSPMIWMKGAPETVLDRCAAAVHGGEEVPLDEALRSAILAEDRRLAARAYRVLGFASRPAVSRDVETAEDEALESDLTFLGLQALIDPIRPEVPAAIDECREAGIRVLMATGDNLETARAIAAELGLRTERAATGTEIEALSDGELRELAATADVFARVSPRHKVRLLHALRADGRRVAMTGDGVNDSPALRAADVGVAMGCRGTDVARESADLVLLDDNFTTIRDAVAEGRGIFDNIRRFVTFLLSANVGEVLIVFLGVLLGTFAYPEIFRGSADALILTPAMLLWINLVTDGPPALALGVDPRSAGIMRRPPRAPDESVLNRPTVLYIVWIGASLTVVGLALFFLEIRRFGDPVGARTLLFTFIVVAEMGVLGIIRWRSGLTPGSNPWLLAAVAGSLLLHLLVLYTPISGTFGVRGLTLTEWGRIGAATPAFLGLAALGTRLTSESGLARGV